MTTLVKNQTRTYGPKFYAEHGREYRIVATVRYDDQCGNGHNTFSITASIDEKHGNRWREHSGGCCHDEVARHFPELAPYIKWHLCSSDGPMHYVANTAYHAGNQDHRGLVAGERRQLCNGRTGIPVWHRVMRDQRGNEVRVDSSSWTDSAEKPTDTLTADWEPVWIIGEGKARDLDAARSVAVWPDATDDDLTMPGLRERLEARLPALLAEFRAAVEALGFTF